MKSEVRTVALSTGISVTCFVQGQLDQTVDDGGAPLLLIHAWSESWRSFDRLIAALPTFPLVAPDLRGHGHSQKPEGGYSLSNIAEDVVGLLDVLGLTRVHLVGSSSGGYVAQELAAKYPHLVASLVLVGAPLTLHGKPPFANEVELLTDPISEDWVRESLSWYRLLHTVPVAYIEDRVHDGLAMPALIWKASLRGFYEALPPTESGAISAPTLILWGAHDHLVPRYHQRTLAGRIPGSQLKIYEETGHLVLWECPGRVANDVMEFLRTT
ncbi:alpha/beta hydrolase [Paenarthrobacter nitroguajacolicus]|uniref:alpha/beta fold hydrolase n=1 Tax=Paenarthrobacter nitroguajacolicus TaxID=211146 RepID=UPI0015BB8CF8|nr:alpha/beta hydrolase [Paenarthrobacter nitroguajacolicus]NWL13844.1 alpha/beta hydrolase [Paenarthrobacter nitroguajacolicus]